MPNSTDFIIERARALIEQARQGKLPQDLVPSDIEPKLAKKIIDNYLENVVLLNLREVKEALKDNIDTELESMIIDRLDSIRFAVKRVQKYL